METEEDFTTYTWKKLKSENEFEWKHITHPKSILYQNFLIIFDTMTKQPFAFNLKSFKWSQVRLIGEVFDFDHGASFTLYSKNIILVYGGTFTLDQQINQLSKIMSLLTINQIQENLELKCKSIAFEKPMGRAFHSANLFDTKVILFGGQDSTKNATNKLSFVDLASLKVGEFKKAENVPVPRVSHSSVLHKNKLYICGGSDRNVQLNDLHFFDFGTSKWTNVNLKDLNSGTRSLGPAQIYENKIFFFGGNEEKSKSNYLTIYNIDKQKWEMVGAMGDIPMARYYHSTTKYKDNLLVFGGTLNGEDKNIYSLSLNSTVLEPVDKETIEEKILKEDAQKNADAMKELYTQKNDTDIVFVVEAHEIKAHKMILATKSQYFKNMFQSGMIESTQQKIKIPNMKLKVFEALLEHIYIGKATIDVEIAKDLVKVCEEYLLTGLKDQCEMLLISEINLENVLELYEIGESSNSEILQEKCLNFIKINQEELDEKIGLFAFPKSILTRLLQNQFNRIHFPEEIVGNH